MDIIELAKMALEEIGAIGLVNGELNCGCGLSDLMPCHDPDLEFCRPARSHNPNDAEEIESYFYPMEKDARRKI